MYKHVARHKDKKAVLLYRQVPGEDHMCLVAYSDLLPRLYHDSIMKVLESDIGQAAENFADALFRSMMPDGRNCLEALHQDRLIKKVPSNQIIVTPTPTSSIRLDELNNILNEMATGEEAVKRMAKLDAQSGYTGKRNVNNSSAAQVAPVVAESNEALSDHDLAKSRLDQAQAMKANAAQLMAEAERLISEAAALDPTTIPNDNTITTAPKKKASVKAKKD
jgi:hypothetical protein